MKIQSGSNLAGKADHSAHKLPFDSLKREADSNQGMLIEQARSDTPHFLDYVGLFLSAASILLFEITLTRIFSVILWAHLAFMVVGTALFGFGLSGVYLALRGSSPLRREGHYCFYLACSIMAAYLVITFVPFEMWQFEEHPINYLYLATWYVALVVPFFFAGLLVANLLRRFPKQASRLYGADLIGAGTGALSLALILSYFQAEGAVVFSAVLAAIAGLLFHRQRSILCFALLGLGICLTTTLPQAEEIFSLKYHQKKRRFKEAVRVDHILATRWSTLSRVDIAKHRARRSVLRDREFHAIWIDGGTNESVMLKWDGNRETLTPETWSSIGAVYALKKDQAKQVMVIGAAGGKETLIALSHGARHVDAVEMDPSIVHFVNDPGFSEYMGHLYQRDDVTLIQDEGRAFLSRKPPESYDVIQMVNNYTPVAMAAGALNLSETFLLTKEAFLEYYDHLTPNGVLALHRGAALRVGITAIEALRERGIIDPEKHLLITNGEYAHFQGIFLKKSPWTEEEVATVVNYLRPLNLFEQGRILWNPLRPSRDNIYGRLFADHVAGFYQREKSLGLNLFPATDDRPFLEHFLQFGRHGLAQHGLPYEFIEREKQKSYGLIPRGDLPYVVMLIESAALALIFVGIPLFLRRRKARAIPGFSGFLGYFAALGFSFIVVELCLMKRYVLFLGNPAYSITTVLVALLFGAGVGSMCSEKLGKSNPRRAVSVVILLIALSLIFEAWISPYVFQACLAFPFFLRIGVASCLLLPLGFLMGMAFPLGLKLINELNALPEEKGELTAWAWGINGYTTVIGSSAAVFVALFLGFRVVLFAAIGTYLLGLVAIRRATAVVR